MASLQSNPVGQASAMANPPNEPNGYSFPRSRLKQSMNDSSKIPLLLVACGSFSPITYLHLRMFEMAADFAKYNTEFEVVGGYLSPVSDAYRKAGLASAEHRVAMTRIATDQSSRWLDVDPWEAIQKEYQPTAIVLDHFEHEINVVQRGIAIRGGQRKAVKIVLLAGADLIQTMSTPGVWSQEDLNHILGRYGVFIVERTGTDIDDALATLTQWRQNIWVIQQLIQNDVSSTKIRLFLKREMSVRYLVPAPVISYIEEHGLYEDDGASSSIHEKDKESKSKLTAETSESR
ncbi:Nicotinamide/nicotinic acid mononucleotide adenylyltransferase 1 [Xanthoria parietina]